LKGGRVVVIGGGPAGLLATGRAAERGALAVLLEKNAAPGKKLLLSGKGRCNLTSSEEDTDLFLSKYGRNGRFLYSVFSRFGPAETISFFESIGVELKEERGKRIFPAAGGAPGVLDALRRYAVGAGAEIRCENEALDLVLREGRVRSVLTKDGEIEGDAFIICTGGKSFPRTGSTGDGYRFARRAGHTVVPPVPALCPVRTAERWPETCHGLTLRNVSLSLRRNGKVTTSRFGELLLTHFGLSGPIAMDMSKEIAAALESGGGELVIDLKPALTHQVLTKRIRRDLDRLSGKHLKEALGGLLPSGLISAVIMKSPIPEQKLVNDIGNREVGELAALLKAFQLTPTGLLGFNWAVVTSGGVAIDEIDPGTMRSKIVENLFFAGEVIDIDGPTGGFNLQMCWSTGHQAGESAAVYAKSLPRR